MRIYHRLRVRLSKQDRKELQELLRGGLQPVRVVLRALTLWQLAGGQTAAQVAANLDLTPKAVRQIGGRYQQRGLDRALYDRQRPGAVPALNPSPRQRIVAILCSDPPEGYSRWTVRLMAQQAVKRKLVPKVGRETIRVLLRGHELKPWRGKNVVRGRSG